MSKTAQHTPGPWKALQQGWDAQNGEWQMTSSGRAFGKYKGFAPDGVTTNDEDFANAALIAAAPALLAALIEAKEVLESADRYFPSSIKNPDRFRLLNVLANAVNPAIAKAQGGAK